MYYGVVIRDTQARVECFVWNNSSFDHRVYNQGLAFKTKTGAMMVCDKLNEKYNSLLKQAIKDIKKEQQ